ncbi:aromatic acid exporter family member 2 domain-containing protein [Trichoderma breve]|uniref:Aromatic acid exporter family member 2 domain-containing protein n=1 Tax=Trichoderma breve TaxID=2034170 RepID=A0A9W9JRR9_9HYPO|nr:aromatic acid exporter family member 2 domain-containing protein [Trichoderma breve]KAJ4865244.1 aromatic acid exporter family member 2 domain-containing protein [Trichoderma breve]
MSAEEFVDNGADNGTKKRALPSLLNHFNGNDLKTLFRCSIAAWVAALLIFIEPSLQSIGISTFFAALVLFVTPPAGILLIYLLGSLSLLVGLCLGWAWGILTMKAALAARPASDTQSQLQALQQAAVAQAQSTGQNATVISKILVYEGHMLDARVTVVYYVMSCAFIYFLSRLRANNVKLTLLHLFGNIVVDVFLLTGPLLPTFTPLLGQVLVKPGAIGVGIGAACCLIFFPQSTSYVVLRKMEQLIRMFDIPLDLTQQRFNTQKLEVEQLRQSKDGMIALYKAMEPEIAFLPLDISRGRWNADDVKGLKECIRQTMIASTSLIDFHITTIIALQKESKAGLQYDKHSSDGQTGEKGSHEIGQRHVLQYAELMKALRTPEQSDLRIRMIEAMRETTAQQVFDALVQRMETSLAALQSAREFCVTNTTEAIIDCHSDLFDQDGQLKISDTLQPQSLQAMMVAMVLEERILGVAVAMETMLKHVLQLTTSQTRHRIWLPSRIRYAFHWIFSGRKTIPIAGVSDDGGADDPDVADEQSKEVRQRLRLIRGYEAPTRAGPVARAVAGTYRWLTNPAGMYAMRMVVTCVLLYMADFTFSLISRALGTVIGGVFGLVAWYIGSGSGPGNPYGLAASVAVFTVISMWLRIFLPLAYTQATAMCGVTFILIIGFSYDNVHLPQYGNPGRGYQAFWKRLVTVLLGFLAATIVQLFPKPPSATGHVCKTLANTVRTLSDYYALLLSHWSRANQEGPIGATAIEELTLEVAEILSSLNGSLALLKVDFSAGPFDQAVLRQTQEQCRNMNQALGRLLYLSTTLPKEFQERLVTALGILDDGAIGNIMAVLAIVEQALRTGSPLPERLPVPLVRTCFESLSYAQHHKIELSTTLVRDENYRRYCVAVSSYLKFLTAIDDLVLCLKEALGERHVIYLWDDDV